VFLCSRARERFAVAVTPLLVLLGEYTGYKLTLLAGRVQTEPDVDVKVVAYVNAVILASTC
jgi:hypothetical protein